MPRAGWLAVGAIAGALASSRLEGLSLAVVAGLAAAGIGLGLAARRPVPTAIAIGVAVILLRGIAGGPAGSETVDQTVDLTSFAERRAQVVSLAAPAGGHQRAVLELLPPAPAERVYAWLPRYPALIPGDELLLRGQLEVAPDGPGFGEYLLRSGISYTARPRTIERLDDGATGASVLEQLRRAGGDALARVLPEPQAGLAAAILIGLRDLVARDVSDAFRTSGLSHVVAISGWHVALVGGVVAAALRRLPRRSRSLVTVIVIGLYAVLAGASPSVVRAALMATVVVLARESGRKGQAAAALGVTATVMLLAEPETVTDIGFQLSLTATAGLLAWAGPLAERLRRHLPERAPRWLVDALAVSLAAQAATLPLVLLHFGRLSLVAPLANLLIAPIVAPVMLAAALALAAGLIVPAAAGSAVLAPFTFLGAVALGLMVTIAQATAAVPFASVELPPPLDLASALAATVGVMAAGRRLRRSAGESGSATSAASSPGAAGRPAAPVADARRPRVGQALLAGLCALSVVLALVAVSRSDGRLHVTVLDVGQGDAILLEGPRGGRMLVDTGPDPDRLLSLLDARIPAWDRRLDLVVITHPHEDHVAGLALLLDRYRIEAVGEPGMIGPGPGDAAFRSRMAEMGRTPRVLAAGDRLVLDGVRIDVHWPRRGSVPLAAADSGTGINNVSLVLELSYGARRFLLTGDVEEEIDPQLLSTDIAAGAPLDVLKVAHHGSGTATTDAFVERLRPRVAIVSAGWGNPYGHPSPRTVARLQSAGARLFRTDLDGSVEITTDGQNLAVAAAGGRPRPVSVDAAPPGVGFCPVPSSASRGRRRPYNRAHGRALPPRRRRAPPAARPAGVVHGALDGGRRSRGLPGTPAPPARLRHRHRSGRGGGAAARRGQGAAGGRRGEVRRRSW